MIEVLQNIPLSKKTFYGIGGPADEIYEIHDTDGLGELWAETIAQNIPKIVLGKGSNIVFADKGFRGRIFIPIFQVIDPQKVTNNELFISAQAGTSFQSLIEETNRLGFKDLCNLSGIPGNVGGFVRGNAGAYGIETGDFVVAVDYLDENGVRQKKSAKDCHFSYRESLFKQNSNLFILKATFKLTQKSDPQKALDQTRTLLQERWQKYPPGRSGGCVFKNPNQTHGLFAGKMLDELHAKGDRCGDIEISKEHANFFVNKGKGTQKDVLKLIKKWKKKVYDKYKVKLEPEIFIVDEFGTPFNL